MEAYHFIKAELGPVERDGQILLWHILPKTALSKLPSIVNTMADQAAFAEIVQDTADVEKYGQAAVFASQLQYELQHFFENPENQWEDDVCVLISESERDLLRPFEHLWETTPDA